MPKKNRGGGKHQAHSVSTSTATVGIVLNSKLVAALVSNFESEKRKRTRGIVSDTGNHPWASGSHYIVRFARAAQFSRKLSVRADGRLPK
jgi:hypothetical protein